MPKDYIAELDTFLNLAMDDFAAFIEEIGGLKKYL